MIRYDRMFKSMANTGNFECQHCTVVRSHKVDRPGDWYKVW